MNDVQNKVLDLLENFIVVCEKLGLKYYLANGSALGAEKYGGFIPWDDDIDVAMPRCDYDIFCKHAKEYLPRYIFVQNFRTDKNFPLFYTKLRNIETTFIEEGVKNLDINHGIYLDVFALDGYPKTTLQKVWLRCRMKVLRWQQFCGFKESDNLPKRLFRKMGYSQRTYKTLGHIERLVKKYGDDTSLCCDYGDRQERGIFPRFYYGEGRFAKFEHLEVVIPYSIDEYLTEKYGAWREELPSEKQKSHHSAVIVDTKHSYMEYINNF